MSTLLTKPELKILTAVGVYRHLSAYQLERLLYPNQLKGVQNHLHHLWVKGQVNFVGKPDYQRTSPGGRNLRIYYLSGKGLESLRELGMDVPKRASVPPKYPTLLHSLAISDVLIACHQLVRARPLYQLTHLLTEYQLKQAPAGGIAPDACVVIETDQHRYPIVFEVDRGTEDRVAFRKKINGLARYTQGDFKQHVDAKTLNIAFVLSETRPARLRNLMAWAQAELLDMGALVLAPIFLFTAIDPVKDQSQAFFVEPVWEALSSEQRVVLLS